MNRSKQGTSKCGVRVDRLVDALGAVVGVVALSIFGLAGCESRSGGSEQQPAASTATQTSSAESEAQELPPFVGKVWLSITRGDAPGTIIVFLPNKTVLRDSCYETYRVAQWGIISDTRIRWVEDLFPIEAEWSQPSVHELVLKPVGTGRQETYVEISVPYVCPERK